VERLKIVVISKDENMKRFEDVIKARDQTINDLKNEIMKIQN
jgi:hypothetical protein